jgi:hypothetical protein
MTAENCEYEIPACKEGIQAALIESPCERYKVCAVDKTPLTSEVLADPDSACVAAALLIVAASFA